ncbi:hypothetical protein Tco_0622423 [Tanacetum coccineum]
MRAKENEGSLKPYVFQVRRIDIGAETSYYCMKEFITGAKEQEKPPMIIEETPKKSKEQALQEEASLAKAIRLDTLQKDEVAKQIHLDSLLAQRIAEEEELNEQQKKRKAQVQFEAQHYTNKDWDLIRAKIEANAELSKSMLGSELQGEDFTKKMVDLVNQRKKYFAQERARAKRNKSMTQSHLKTYMMNYLKNQGTWNFEATKASLKRFGEELQTKTPKRLKDEAKDDESTKKSGKRRKQMARRGFHTNIDKDDSEGSDEDSEQDDSVTGAKGLTSPEQTATGKGISNPFMAVMVCQKPYGIQLTNVSSTETLKNSCCKDKKRRLEVLQIKNNLKNSIYNILRKLKVFKVKIKNVLKELEVHNTKLSLANSNSYLRDILGDILGKDMYYPLTFVKPIRVSLVYKRNPKAQCYVRASQILNQGPTVSPLGEELSLFDRPKEVEKFGDSYKVPPEEPGKEVVGEASTKKKGRTMAITTKDIQKRRNDVKRNRDDLDTMSLDDLYNHLKVYKPEVQKRAGSNSQNMSFISSSNISSGKSKVPTAQGVSTASVQVSTTSTNVVAASLSHDTVCTFIATQSNGSQIKYEDITQINEDDIEEIDIKWNLAMLSMRDDRFWKKTGKKITNQGSDDWSYMAEEEENHALVADDDVVPIEFTLMAMSSSSSDNEIYDDSYCSKSCRKNTKNLNTKISKLNEELSDCESDLFNYKRGLSQVEARLVEFKVNETKFYERIRVLERDVEIRDNKIKYLRNKFEEVKKEKESIDHKLAGFRNASKDLNDLLESQRCVKDKTSVGFDEYSAIPPPPTQVYLPSVKDPSWIGLPEFVNDTVTDYTRPTPSVDISSKHEEDNFSVFEQRESSGNIVSMPWIKFVKGTGCPSVIKVNNTENARKTTVKYVEMYRNTSKSPRIRGNQRN